MQGAAKHHERNTPSVRKLQEIRAALLAIRLRDAQPFRVGAEVVPLGGAGHGGADGVDAEVAEGEDELGHVGEPAVPEGGGGGEPVGAEGDVAVGGGAPAPAGEVEAEEGEGKAGEDALGGGDV